MPKARRGAEHNHTQATGARSGGLEMYALLNKDKELFWYKIPGVSICLNIQY